MSSPAISEIVTFRLKEGATADAFLTAMDEMAPFVARMGGMVQRTLSCDADGLWTDHVLWETAAHAHALADAFMAAPETEAARALIDETSLIMRHGTVMLHQV